MSNLVESLPNIPHANGIHETPEFSNDQVKDNANKKINDVLWLRIYVINSALDAFANGMNSLNDDIKQYISEKMDDFIT